MSKLVSRRNIDFLLFDWLRLDDLLARPLYEDHDRDTVTSVIDLGAQIAQEQFAPINQLLDAQEPTMADDGTVLHPDGLKQALAAYTDSGLPSAAFPPELGGMLLPFSVVQAVFVHLHAASMGAAGYPMLGAGNAALLYAYGSPEQITRFAVPVVEGRWYGTMCLSEPDVGSSLGDLTTRAVPQDDGTWRVFGTKMWISGGDQSLSDNIIHLVLARTPDGPAGVKGLSLFVVPKVLVEPDGSLGERNDVTLVGLNHKMGCRGTTNTLLSFGEGRWTPGGAPGAVGELVGEVGQGLAAMFHMMNEARIGVGLGAVALGNTGYLHSLAYAVLGFLLFAGGIGITPFLARLGELARTNKAQQTNGDLFYCTPSRKPGDFPSQLEPLCQAAGIKLHCRQTDQDGPLSAQEVKACLQPSSSVWFCGPAAWGTALGKSLIAHGLPETAFHREAFEFR